MGAIAAVKKTTTRVVKTKDLAHDRRLKSLEKAMQGVLGDVTGIKETITVCQDLLSFAGIKTAPLEGGVALAMGLIRELKARVLELSRQVADSQDALARVNVEKARLAEENVRLKVREEELSKQVWRLNEQLREANPEKSQA